MEAWWSGTRALATTHQKRSKTGSSASWPCRLALEVFHLRAEAHAQQLARWASTLNKYWGLNSSSPSNSLD